MHGAHPAAPESSLQMKPEAEPVKLKVTLVELLHFWASVQSVGLSGAKIPPADDASVPARPITARSGARRRRLISRHQEEEERDRDDCHAGRYSQPDIVPMLDEPCRDGPEEPPGNRCERERQAGRR